MRQFTESKLLVASHNPGKIREIAELLEPFSVDVSDAASAGAPEPVEDGETFIANAKIKALSGAQHTGIAALADDSGLCVPALDGAPGIYSARWAGPDKDFTVAMQKVWDELDKRDVALKDRKAYFICALALAWGDGHVECFEGRVDGHLVWPPRGDKGFGYDPIFMPEGHDISFAEMDPKKKHAMSHRARAFKQLVEACFEQND